MFSMRYVNMFGIFIIVVHEVDDFLFFPPVKKATNMENKMLEHTLTKIFNSVLLRFASSSVSHKHAVINNEMYISAPKT